jgi:hypothetical protein
VFKISRAFIWNKKKKLTTRMHGVESFKIQLLYSGGVRFVSRQEGYDKLFVAALSTYRLMLGQYLKRGSYGLHVSG